MLNYSKSEQSNNLPSIQPIQGMVTKVNAKPDYKKLSVTTHRTMEFTYFHLWLLLWNEGQLCSWGCVTRGKKGSIQRVVEVRCSPHHPWMFLRNVTTLLKSTFASRSPKVVPDLPPLQNVCIMQAISHIPFPSQQCQQVMPCTVWKHAEDKKRSVGNDREHALKGGGAQWSHIAIKWGVSHEMRGLQDP